MAAGGDSDEQDGFMVKKKNDDSSSSESEPEQASKKKDKTNQARLMTDKDFFENMYGDSTNLDKDDRFLLRYIQQ